MSRLERSWANALLEAFAPAGGEGLSPRPGEVDYLATFDRMREGATRQAALGLRVAVWLVALSPLWQGRGVFTLRRLPPVARAARLAELLVHRVFFVRELSLLLKLCASLALLGCPSVRARCGYDDVASSPENQSGLRRKGSLRVLAADAPAKARGS